MSQHVIQPASRVRRAAKGLMFRFLDRSGVTDALARSCDVSGATILMYHSVAREDHAPWIDPRHRISAAQFESQMAFLARHRRVISMDALVDALKCGSELPRGATVLTFDDGYVDTLTVAAPILARHRLPATVYLPTGYIDRGEAQWVDQLYSMFQHRSRHVLALQDEHRTYRLDQRHQRLAAYAAACRRLMTANFEQRRTELGEIRAQLTPTADPPRLTMNWTEVRSLIARAASLTIGAHTREHLDYTACTGNEAASDLAGCMSDLRSELQITAAHFSFPYGRASGETRVQVRESGFASAACSGQSCLIRSDSDCFSLARIDAPRSVRRLRFLTGSGYALFARSMAQHA